jgi:hypothetical protein
MKNWKQIYSSLPDEELDKIAILRVMECTNGIIQYAFRDGEDYALSIDDTRRAMKFSMSCMKRMQIPMKEETITFAPETEELMRQARDCYVKGYKQGDAEALREFNEISKATAQACGVDRLIAAKKILEENVDDIPPDTLQWGLGYLMQFFR